ncbi:hypothetical protein [uncultured Pelagimonas sp.]|uniref:hypothetical protein n=1 Tax=uncultured Pelagimonas sp. TaxID=1618102 RepID=UPI002616804E|nr:hypothetical protein [uncultured Pelagimonas sp.]
MQETSTFGEFEALKYAIDALLDFEQQYSQVEIMDLFNRHTIQSGDSASLQSLLVTASTEPLSYEAVQLTIAHLVRTAQPVPKLMEEWLGKYLAGKLPKPKRNRRSRRAFPGENFERDRTIHLIVNELEERGVPRSETVSSGFFFAYEIVAQANRNLGKKPNSANGIRAIWERRERDIRDKRNTFSQIDLLLLLNQA